MTPNYLNYCLVWNIILTWTLACMEKVLCFANRLKDSQICTHFNTEESPTLHVVAENGSVEVEMQDWATSIGVKLPF